jgi:serine/threonine protein kinase
MTEHGRGSAGYRAPELVSDACYSTKVDIWALGCIAYEIQTRTKAFSDDYEVYSYSLGELEIGFPDQLALGTSEQFIWQAIRSMLLIQAIKRPKARSLHQQFRSHLQRLRGGRRSPSPSGSSTISELSFSSVDAKTGKCFYNLI